MASQDIIYLTFEKYLNKAKELHKAGDLLNAKKFYLLAAGEMLQLAKASTGEVQKTRNARVKNLMDVAKSLDTQKGGNDGKDGENDNGLPPEPQKKVSLEESLNKLNALIGLDKVKKQVNDWVKQIQVFQKRKTSGLSVPEMSYHLVFSGNPGTGKTTVARIMADIYCALGIVSKGHLVEVSKPDLVAGFVGQTSIKTQDVLNKAYGGVLFIDEAYSITVGGEFGQESIDTMVKYMEDKRDDIVVIVAGYEGPMKNFIATNMGLRSRFKNFITFDDYTGEELFQIFKKLCKGNQYETTAEAEAYIKNYLRKLYLNRGADYANGRDARNLFESIVTNQSARVSQIANPSNEDLVTITVEDLPFIGEVKMDDCFTSDVMEVAPIKEEIPEVKAPQNDQNGSIKDLIPEKTPQEREEKPHSPEDKVLDGAGVIDSEFKFDWDNLPSITFDDVAGLEQVKETVRVKVLLPLKNAEAFEGYVKKSGGGLLLYGPPGTGKTMIAAAIANEIGAKFCSVKPSDLLHQGAGQSEKAIRALFAQARQFPCSVVYFDEMDSISPKNTRSQYAKQLRSEFLAQLQGIDSYGKDNGHILFLIAATNKPWDIDSAFVRPGRFGTRIYVGLPDSPARNYMVESRLSKIAKKGIVKVAEDIPYEEIVEKTEGFNCSDISNLLDKIEELSIIRGIRTGEKSILKEDFDKALEEVKSSVQRDDIEKLQEWTAENN